MFGDDSTTPTWWDEITGAFDTSDVSVNGPLLFTGLAVLALAIWLTGQREVSSYQRRRPSRRRRSAAQSRRREYRSLREDF